MIPAGKEIRLSQEIYYFMLMQVPQGQLTRDCDIREYLNELYGVACIDFDILATLRTLPGYSESFLFSFVSFLSSFLKKYGGAGKTHSATFC